MSNSYGIEWKPDSFWGIMEPHWTEEPDVSTIENLARQHLNLTASESCTVTFLAEGSFNKVYKIEAGENMYVLRVAMPIDAPHKLSSEVATVRMIRQNTSIPTIEPIAFECSSDNPLRFPWTLMKFIEGKTLREQWHLMSIEKKEKIIRDLAKYYSECFQHRYGSIGSLHLDHSKPGRLVSIDMIRADPKTPRGPFRNSHAYLHTRLTAVLAYFRSYDITANVNEDEDYDELDLDGLIRTTNAALEVLPIVFPPTLREACVLSPPDISESNIILDDEDNIKAIIDWEFTETVPLFQAFKSPILFNVPFMGYEPKPYEKDGITLYDGYKDDLHNWEMHSRYKPMFLEEIERLEPFWEDVCKNSVIERKFYAAVKSLEDGVGSTERCVSKMREWAEIRLESEEHWMDVLLV